MTGPSGHVSAGVLDPFFSGKPFEHEHPDSFRKITVARLKKAYEPRR